MVDIAHQIEIHAGPRRVYDALTTQEDLTKWLAKEARVQGMVGANWAFTFQGEQNHFVTNMLVRELKPGKSIVWECIGGPSEWMGTRLSFSLTGAEGKTTLRFMHSGWKEPSQFFIRCAGKWQRYLRSLKFYLETGSGKPNPEDTSF
jgi:uncharacterized protein YndB with AHSA1/START domain